MAVKANYHTTLAHLWKHPTYGGFFAEWEEAKPVASKHKDKGKSKGNTRTRRKALCLPGNKRATKDPKLAKKLLNQFNQQLLMGKVRTKDSLMEVAWGNYKDELLDYIEATRADGTFKLYQQALNKASDCWGDHTVVSEINGRHIDRLTSSLLQDGLSSAYVAKVYRHVKAALKKATEWGYAKPLIFPKAPPVPKTVRYIPIPELTEIMGKIEDPEFYDFCTITAYLGLRSGEALRLTPQDIDNPKGFLRISAKQKNRQESRVPINSTAREVLDRCIARMEKAPMRKTLWRWTTVTYIGQLFKRVARAAGYEDFHFHDLRHTFASYMAMQGEPLKAIQELMRHKSITSTMVYAHLSPQHLVEASERFTLGPMPRPKDPEEE